MKTSCMIDGDTFVADFSTERACVVVNYKGASARASIGSQRERVAATALLAQMVRHDLGLPSNRFRGAPGQRSELPSV